MEAPDARGAGATAPVSRLVAIALACALLIVGPIGAARAGNQQLKHARQELHQTRARIHARMDKLRALQQQMDRLATQISDSESIIEHMTLKMKQTAADIVPLQQRLAELEARLALRSREAYILGPGAPMLYLLTATSAADAATRLSFLDEMNRRDAILADAIAATRDDLEFHRAQLERFRYQQRAAIDGLHRAQHALQKTMADSRRLLSKLQSHRDQVLADISRIHPFRVCPVGDPHAVADDFGIWVHRPEKWGGNHIHQGNDIMAPEGTPIYAPFDGTAVVATNHIGGMAVKVLGQFGYVYNAHLSRFGKLGPVKTGDVIGYVGHTGDTGANHDHFEWHPGNGPAVDPHGFLMQVC